MDEPHARGVLPGLQRGAAALGLVGLAVVRALAVLPLVKCFLRPVIPVAAAHLLAAGEAGSGEGSPS